MSILDILSDQERLVTPTIVTETYWAAHVPFVRWLVGELKPITFVELGTENGHSFFNIAESMHKINLQPNCFAVDTWLGDKFTLEYPEDVFNNVVRINKEVFQNRNSLLRMHFNSALNWFQDRSIDLLHIDGSHRYEDVKEDFQNWLPKVSEDGVILIHDIHVRDPNFGVYDFWQEIKHSFKHIEFFHGFGLGVLFVGENKYSKLVKEFNFHTNEFVAIFETLGARYLKNIEIMNFQVKSSLESELNFMKNSSIWKVTLPFRQLKWGISWIILYIHLNLFPKSQPNKVRNSGYKLEESKSQIAKIGVIFHIYYQDEILEVVRNLKFIDAPFDLYVTAHNPINESIFAQLEQMQQIKVNYFENKGRDILPFILMFQKYNLYKYNLILKIHTKKSHWISKAYTNSLGYFNGQAWSKSLLKDLLGSTRNCFEIFKIFEDKAKIGILASKDSTLLLKNAFGENKQDFSKLIRTLGIRFFPIFSKFPAGSMYWFRPEIFSQDLIEKITSLTFQDELGQVDGTMSHAIERVIGVLAHQSRFLLVEHKFESNDELHRKVNW